MAESPAQGATPSVPPEKLTLCIIGALRSNHVYTRASIFRRFGHDVFAVTHRPRADADLTQHTVGVGPGRRLWWLSDLWSQARGLRQARADVYHLHYALGPLAYLSAICHCQPMVISTMGGDVLHEEQHELSRAERWLLRATLQSARAVTAKTHRMSEILRQLGVRPERISRVVWGIDAGHFSPRPQDEARVRFDLPPTAKVVLSTRHLQPIYNIVEIVRGFALLAQREPRALLIVCRRNPNPGYEDALLKLIDTLACKERVRLIEPVNYQDMPWLYAAADVVVSVPSSDGLPQTLLEAQACERAVLAGEASEFDEFCVNEASVLETRIAPANIAEGLHRLLNDDALRARLGRNGRHVVTSGANIETESRRVEALYRQLASQSQPHRTSIGRRLAMALALLWITLAPALRLTRRAKARTGEI